MDRLIKGVFLGIPLLVLVGSAIALFGPIIWVIIFNPIILGTIAFGVIVYLLSRMEKDKNKNVR
jgi:hypothetical protein